MSKRISTKKILAQFVMVSSIFAFLYTGVVIITEKMGGKFKRSEKIQSMKHDGSDQLLTESMAKRIIDRKKKQDATSLKLLLAGLSLAGFAYGLSLYKKNKK